VEEGWTDEVDGWVKGEAWDGRMPSGGRWRKGWLVPVVGCLASKYVSPERGCSLKTG
jgi:hypothetical protein